MNLQPHQRQFAPQYAGPAYPQQQHPQNLQAQPAPEPCYNCGSPQHVAQHCREARRAVPAGSLNQTPRPQRGASQKRNNKPVVTRFAPPPNYANGNYPPQPPFPQTGTYQSPSQTAPYQPPHQQQQPSQQWQQQQAAPQSYTPTQSWQQQPYGASPVAPSPQPPAYGPHQPVPNFNYNQPTQPAYTRQHQQSYGGYTPQASYPVQAQPSQPAHPQYPAHQAHPQTPYPQHQNYQQYPQQQPVQSPYTPTTPSFPQASHHGHGPQPQFSQAPIPNGVVPPQQQPPPPKPPPCFPNTEKNANTSAKSGIIIWRPAQPAETPLEATFIETEEQRGSKNKKESRFSKYFDAKGRRINRDFYGEDSEMMKDPIWKSIRTGGSMLAQPLDWELPDEPEEEVKTETDAEEAREKGIGGAKVEIDEELIDRVGDGIGEAKSEKEAKNASSELKKPWVRQPITSIANHTSHTSRYEGMNNFSNNGTRGRTNGINQGGKRKSRSPLDSSRPQKHRVREPITRTLPQPSHHPLPPKPVAVPPPVQHFNQNRQQNLVVNRRGGHKSQRAHPYARRSASPVRHFLVDTQNQRRGGYGGGGGGNRRQQGVSNTG